MTGDIVFTPDQEARARQHVVNMIDIGFEEDWLDLEDAEMIAAWTVRGADALPMYDLAKPRTRGYPGPLSGFDPSVDASRICDGCARVSRTDWTVHVHHD